LARLATIDFLPFVTLQAILCDNPVFYRSFEQFVWMGKEVNQLESDISPRSTILLNVALMTSTRPSMNASNMDSDVIGSTDDSKAKATPKETLKDIPVEIDPNPASPAASFKGSFSGGQEPVSKLGSDDFFPPTPTPHEYVIAPNHGYPISLTPQSGSFYHFLGYAQQHVTPEPPSPAGHHSVIDVYNVGTFFHQHQAGVFGTPTVSTGGAALVNSNIHVNVPMSPPRGMSASASMDNSNVLPASPLFPRATSSAGALEAVSQQRVAPPGPSIPYIASSQQSFTGPISRATDDGSWSGANIDRFER
jgi:hypothetical protein